VQAKSKAEPIVYEKPHEIAFITSLEDPLLICVADRENMAVDVYSTWNVMCGLLAGGSEKITLVPGVRRDDWPGVIHHADKSQEIRLGPPIVRIMSNELFDRERMDAIATVISDWVSFDRRNIVNRSAELYWVQGPLDYTTGQRLDGSGGIASCWHPDNIPGASRNLGRAATALELILRDHLPAPERGKPEWVAREAALQETLRTHWPLLDDGLKSFLRSQGFNFDA
jgi:hypothetical protein